MRAIPDARADDNAGDRRSVVPATDAATPPTAKTGLTRKSRPVLPFKLVCEKWGSEVPKKERHRF